MINTTKPFKIFTDYVEHAALVQFQDCMNQDFVVQGALMPDCHAGYAAPIGSVLKTKDYIVPAYIGFDIGCGVSALKLNIKKQNIINYLENIKDDILTVIPLGNKTYSHNDAPTVPKKILNMFTKMGLKFLDRRGKNQLGTLGGGNHFIEISYGQDDFVWIVIHSGSRGLGHGIAGHYMNVAAELNGVTSGSVEKSFGIHKTKDDFNDYLQDVVACQEWALENRTIMSNKVCDIIGKYINQKINSAGYINRNHNHIDILPDGYYIHRKGATHAENGMYGVIPANMAEGAFIVVGKGNNESMSSSSHGAGRVMSRSAAKNEFCLEELQDKMAGIICNISESTIDEHPCAYKDIYEVMENQKELVGIVDHVKPLLNIKG